MYSRYTNRLISVVPSAHEPEQRIMPRRGPCVVDGAGTDADQNRS
ncbi:hypothetical protein MINT15_19040 [Saccharomonospora viridis]|uniref:Uncharacterized protein n=1 Tax=Saccharomonospora viridis TaxID=1852 RepID=A0A837DCB5_9PSEU|nr:hypothetical protein MINT15_19040 [Saccharomonospora viridis]